MNTFERRQIVREQMIDAVVAKSAINKSRRDRAKEVRKLQKAMEASRATAVQKDVISYSAH